MTHAVVSIGVAPWMKRSRAGSLSGYPGVSWDAKGGGKWAAWVRLDGRRRCLGKYSDREAAINVVKHFRAEHGLEIWNPIDLEPYHLDALSGIAIVPLGSDRGFTLVDGRLAEVIGKHNWHLHKSGYVHACKGVLPLHQLVWKLSHGCVPAQLDHINGDRLNNLLSNLRACSHGENCRNRKMRSDSKSGFKGVHFIPTRGLWRASITLNGARHYLGDFKTPDEAHAAYCAKAAELHGEFARF